MEEHQMTIGALGYIPLEKRRSLDFVCCIKMNLRLRPVLRNKDEHCIGTRRSRHDNSEHQDEARLIRNLAALSHKPQGGWEEDETIEDAAQCETVEEAGVQGEVECKLGTWYFENKAGDTAYEGHMFPLSQALLA